MCESEEFGRWFVPGVDSRFVHITNPTSVKLWEIWAWKLIFPSCPSDTEDGELLIFHCIRGLFFSQDLDRAFCSAFL